MTGYNDKTPSSPCGCGSGRKYKKCCQPTTSYSAQILREDSLRTYLREAEGQLVSKLQKFLEKSPNLLELMGAAAAVYSPMLTEVEDGNHDIIEYGVCPWFFFTRLFSRERLHPLVKGKSGNISIAEIYRETSTRSALEHREGLLLTSAAEARYGIYQVKKVEPERALVLQELGNTTEIRVIEYTLSQYEEIEGNFILARVLDFCGRKWFLGVHPLVVPARYHGALLKCEPTDQMVRQMCFDVSEDTLLDASTRAKFFLVYSDTYTKPSISNRDGDPMGLYVAMLSIPALSKKHIKSRFKQVTRSLDKRRRGEIVEISKGPDSEGVQTNWYHWIGSSPKVEYAENEQIVFAELALQQTYVYIRTNSLRRMIKTIERLEEVLEHEAFAEADVLAEFASVREIPTGFDDGYPEMPFEEEDIPESERERIDEGLQQQIDDYVNKWPHMPIPALGNRTPTEASKDPQLRPVLESILVDFERNARRAENTDSYCMSVDQINAIRAKLGLISVN